MGQSGKDFGVNSSNAASLKGKLQTLEEAIQNVADEMNNHKKEVGQPVTKTETFVLPKKPSENDRSNIKEVIAQYLRQRNIYNKSYITPEGKNNNEICL